MARANIIIQDELLKELDRPAAQEHLSRSAYIQTATRLTTPIKAPRPSEARSERPTP
jgi:metal-responsive CopG/Arc/MetJ family transcriptional regulator